MARRKQSVTIRHVADDAGVSLQTVSRVINKQSNVRPEKQERVQASIDRLGYVPSIAAQRMSGSRSYLIVAINDRARTISDWRARQGTDWVDQMLLGGMLTCAKRGYRMLVELVDTHSDHVERELDGAIAALQPDGIVLTPPHSENPIITGYLARRAIPFACIGTEQAPGGLALTMDDQANAERATRHLIDLGHRAIGFIAGPEDYSLSNWRIAGWQRVMDENGFSTRNLCERGDFGYDSGLLAARSLLDRSEPPTAIIASSDHMALACREVAKERDLRVPQDLSIVSFDNTPVMRFTQPRMTAIDQPIAETVSRAVEWLIDATSGTAPDDPINVAGSLVIRESTAAPLQAEARDGGN